MRGTMCVDTRDAVVRTVLYLQNRIATWRSMSIQKRKNYDSTSTSKMNSFSSNCRSWSTIVERLFTMPVVRHEADNSHVVVRYRFTQELRDYPHKSKSSDQTSRLRFASCETNQKFLPCDVRVGLLKELSMFFDRSLRTPQVLSEFLQLSTIVSELLPVLSETLPVFSEVLPVLSVFDIITFNIKLILGKQGTQYFTALLILYIVLCIVTRGTFWG